MKHLGMIVLLAAGAACSGPSCAGAPVQAAARQAPPVGATPAASGTRTVKGKLPVSSPMIQRTLTLDEIDRLVWAPGANVSFAPTTIREREALAQLVPALAQGARAATPPDPQAWQQTAHDAGFRIEAWTVDGQPYWALVELPEQRRGAGAYVFRVAPAAHVEGATAAAEILLEAPHAYFDVGTGRLGAGLFFFPPPGARPRAFFTNTIHRYQSAPGKKLKQKNSPGDVAHNPEHGFSTATEAFVRALGGHVLVLQLHGFAGRPDEADDEDVAKGAAAKDATPAGAIAMVVSAGDKHGSSPRSLALAAALTKLFGAGVKRFPEDTRVLGATTNVQMRAIAHVPGAEFVHIEMSAETRKALAGDPALRAKLGTILFDTEAKADAKR
jgi:hypothetical protein